MISAAAVANDVTWPVTNVETLVAVSSVIGSFLIDKPVKRGVFLS